MKVRDVTDKTDQILGMYELYIEREELRREGRDAVFCSATRNVDGETRAYCVLINDEDDAFDRFKELKDLLSEVGLETLCIHAR